VFFRLQQIQTKFGNIAIAPLHLKAKVYVRLAVFCSLMRFPHERSSKPQNIRLYGNFRVDSRLKQQE